MKGLLNDAVSILKGFAIGAGAILIGYASFCAGTDFSNVGSHSFGYVSNLSVVAPRIPRMEFYENPYSEFKIGVLSFLSIDPAPEFLESVQLDSIALERQEIEEAKKTLENICLNLGLWEEGEVRAPEELKEDSAIMFSYLSDQFGNFGKRNMPKVIFETDSRKTAPLYFSLTNKVQIYYNNPLDTGLSHEMSHTKLEKDSHAEIVGDNLKLLIARNAARKYVETGDVKAGRRACFYGWQTFYAIEMHWQGIEKYLKTGLENESAVDYSKSIVYDVIPGLVQRHAAMGDSTFEYKASITGYGIPSSKIDISATSELLRAVLWNSQEQGLGFPFGIQKDLNKNND